MTTLRLGTYNLPPAEVGLLRAFFRLFTLDPGFGWTLVDEAPYDALLVDASTEAQIAEARARARVVLTVGSAASPLYPSEIQRPLRSDKLEAWLRNTARTLSGQATPIATTAAAPGGATASASHQRYKLRRWPPTILLRKDPQRIRLATLMSRKPLSVGEMVALSGQSSVQCESLIGVLKAAGLLDITEIALEPAAAARPEASPSRPLARGFFDIVRSKLGLRS